MQGMWVPMAEAAINVIYNLSEHPDRICGQLVKNLIKTIFGGEENLDGGDANSDKGKCNAITGQSYVISSTMYIYSRTISVCDSENSQF